MQSNAWSAAAIGLWPPVHRPVVDPLPRQRRARLAEMNPNLVGPPCFELTFHQREFANGIEEPDVRDRLSPGLWCAAAPAAVATIPNQIGLQSTRFDLAASNCQVPARYGVPAKLLCQVLTRSHGSGKHHQPAGIPVEPVDGP